MSIVRQFIVNVTSGWVALVIRSVVTLLLFPYLVSKLGDTGNGVWATVGSFLALTAMLDFGLAMAVRRYTARFAALHSVDDQNRLMSTAVVLYGGAGLLAALVVLAVAPFSPGLFKDIPESLAQETVVLFTWAAGLAFLRLLITPFVGFLQGLQRYEVSNMASMVSNLLRFGGTVALLELFPPRLYLVAVAAVVAVSVETLWVIVASRRVWPELRLRLAYFSKKHLKEIAGFGANAFLITLSGMALAQVPNFILDRNPGPWAVTLLAVGLTITGLLREALSGLSTVFMPMFSASHALDNQDELQSRLWKGSQICNLVTWTMIAGIVVYCGPIITCWMGPTKLAAYWAVIILVLGEVTTGADAVTSAALAGCGHLKWLTITRVISASLGVTLVVTSLWFLGWGLAGVAFSIVIPTVLRGLWVPYYCARKLGTPFWPYAVRSYGRPLLSSAILTVACLALRWVYPVNSRLDLIVSAGILAVVSGVIILSVGLSPELRQRLVRPVWVRLGVVKA